MARQIMYFLAFGSFIFTNHAVLDMQGASMLVVPHVESSVMATDLAGLKVIQEAGCFECFTTWREAKVKGEVAASAAILQACITHKLLSNVLSSH